MLRILVEVGTVQSCSVHQPHLATLILPFSWDAIVGCVGHLADDHLLLSYELVDEGGFTYVGSADNTDLDGLFEMGIVGGDSSLVREHLLRFGEPIKFGLLFIEFTIVLRVWVQPSEILLPLPHINALSLLYPFHLLFHISK